MTSRQIARYLNGDLGRLDEESSAIVRSGPPIFEGLAGLDILPRDVLNIQGELRREKYDGFSSTKLFLDLLKRNQESHGVEYFVDWEDPTETRPKRIFWTFRWCIEMWKQFPQV